MCRCTLYLIMDSNSKKRKSLANVLLALLGCDRSNTEDSSAENKAVQKKILIILLACHIAAFVQSLGYSIQHTAFPYLTKKLGVSPEVYGYIISFNAVLQLIGGIFCGRLSDIYGGRFTLIISFITLGMGYSILAVSTNKLLLFISRIPTFAAHALQSMYVIISDVTDVKERADMIGKLGASHGLGMIVGSIIGGLITDKFGIRPAFIVAVVVMAMCVVITILMIPRQTKNIRVQVGNKTIDISDNAKMESGDESSLISTNIDDNGKLLQKPICTSNSDKIDKNTKDINDAESTKGASDNKSFLGLKEFAQVLKVEHMMYLLTVKGVAAIPFGVLSAMFTLVLMDYYKLGPKENGLVVSYLGLVGLASQGYLVGLFSRHIEDHNLLILSSTLMGIGFLFLIISENIFLFCVVAIPLTIGGSLIHIIVTSIITKIVPKELNGSALGLTICIHASIRTVAPTIGGYLLQHVGFFSFGLIGYVMNTVLSVYLFFRGVSNFNIE